MRAFDYNNNRLNPSTRLIQKMQQFIPQFMQQDLQFRQYLMRGMFIVCCCLFALNTLGQNCTAVFINFPAPNGDTLFVCRDAGLIDLSAYSSNATGVFSGIGVLADGATFDATLVDGGYYDVKLTAGADTCQKTITVVDFSLVNGSVGVDTTVCTESPEIDLDDFASPPGGTFFINNVQSTNNKFNPVIWDVGMHIVEYRLGSFSCTRTIEVAPIVFNRNLLWLGWCVYQGQINFSTSVEPAFGTGLHFSGPGIIPGTSIFDPALVGPGEHQIFYSDGVDSCSQTITVPQPVVEAELVPNGELTLCSEGESIVLLGNGISNFSGFEIKNLGTGVIDTFVFSNNTFEFSPTGFEDGMYQIIYSYADFETGNSGCITWDTLLVNVGFAEASLNIAQTVFCGESTAFVSTEPEGGILYADQIGLEFLNENTLDIAASEPGMYWLIYEFGDGGDCLALDSVQIEIQSGSDASFEVIPSNCPTLPDQIFYSGASTLGDSVQLNWSVSDFTIRENPGDTLLLVDWDYPGNYTVSLEIIGGGGCADGETIDVEVAPRLRDSCNVSIFVPNTFTPNDDNLNDVLKVMGEGIVSMHLHIFDRWGEEVYETELQEEGWDGTFKDEPLSPAVFFYYLEYELENGSEAIQKGSITLLR